MFRALLVESNRFSPCNIVFLKNTEKILLQRNYSSDDSKKGGKETLYETLGIQKSATRSEIKKAYYDLTFKYHPDRNEGCTDAALKFRKVTEAYEVLGNYSARKKYDRGVPVSPKDKKADTNAAEHNIKYQKFYDSRTAQRDKGLKYEEFSDSSSERRNTKLSFEKDPGKDNLVLQGVILIFLTVIFLVTRKW